MPRQIKTVFVALSYFASSTATANLRIPFDVQDITVRGVYTQTDATEHMLIRSELFGGQQAICVIPPGTTNAQENTLVRHVQPVSISGTYTFTCLDTTGELDTPTGEIILQLEFESAKN